MRIYLWVILILFTISVKAQNKFTINGFVKDSVTGEEIIGAVIIIKEIPGTGVSTNAYGFYSITLPQGNYTVISQYMGYELKSVQIALKQNTKHDFLLKEKVSVLNEVVITGEKKDENIMILTIIKY